MRWAGGLQNHLQNHIYCRVNAHTHKYNTGMQLRELWFAVGGKISKVDGKS